MSEFLNHIVRANNGYNELLNWSIRDHEKIRRGDIVYWLKVGYGQCGIVGRGLTLGRAYAGPDWSGKGRETYYADFYASVLVNPDAMPLLDSDTLSELIPDFDWRGGHSGLVLSAQQAEKLNVLWEGYVAGNFRDENGEIDYPESDSDKYFI